MDKVATHITFHGTHTGTFQGIQPTGKQVTIFGINSARVADGQIVEQWTEFDALGMLQQLGVIPAIKKRRMRALFSSVDMEVAPF